MEIVNKIIGGVHLDNDPNYQPDNTMRHSLDGVIMDAGEGNYIWEVIKGTALSFSIAPTIKILGFCRLRERFILLTLSNLSNDVLLYEVTFDSNGQGSLELLWFGANSELNLSVDHPVRAMFGFYESQEIQRIYVTDDYNRPWTLNIGYENPLNKQVTLDPKFVPFSPDIDQAYGLFQLESILSGGSLKAGNYFFCWRYINNDYYSDWSYLSNPVNLSPLYIGSNADAYQQSEGAAPDELTTKAIQFSITGLDEDYASIQVAAFYSNDYNSAKPGVIFYDGNLTGDQMVFVYYGNENAGAITIEELLEVSLNIEKIKDMATIKKLNVIGNVKLRDELDVSGLNVQGKNNQIDCTMELVNRHVILDVTGYPTETISSGNKGLFRSPVGSDVSTTNSKMYCGIQYYGLTNGQCTLTNLTTTQSWVAGEIFTLDAGESDGATCTSGTCRPIIALKQYRKSSAGPTPVYSDYLWTTKSLNNHYMDYKSPIVSSMIRSLPQGEKVRFGIVCFDLTGRPFFARWLNNTDVTLGTGDPTIPLRGGTAASKLTVGYDPTTTADGTYYSQVNGQALGIKISNLDLTDIIDQISGFMIVRAPIAHQYLGSGLLLQTFETVNNVYPAPGFIRSGNNDAGHYPGTYIFLSPEDIFGLKDFSIQPGDEIYNLDYYKPFFAAETGESGHQGYGRAVVGDYGNNFNLYQKFLTRGTYTSTGSNGIVGASHEVIYATPYNVTDDDIVFDPRNEILRFRKHTWYYNTFVPPSPRQGINGRMNILVLDIDETSNNIKGLYQRPANDPAALMCLVKRVNANPYGGTDDSSLANTLYMACGHFQPINDTVKTNIESGGRYIFNEIEVFGGDHYICLMDLQHSLIDGDDLVYDNTAHGVIFPVESRINIALREGVHLAKDRPYQPTTNPYGIRYKVGEFKHEEFNYNDGYSSDDINDYYLPIPYNTVLLSEFDSQLRHSPEKSMGERQDSFRIFQTNDRLQLDSNFGELINIRAKFNRIIYWQKDAVGYVPIRERALTQGQFGDPVQLGVGGIFERYDEMTDKIGNQNQFGLVESDQGFHWYDAKRKLFLSLTENMQFSQDSVAKGWNNWFEINIDTDIISYDNPFKAGGFGICGEYDPYHKVVFYAFHNPDSGDIKTIGYDIRNQKLIGEFTMPLARTFRYRNWMFSSKKDESNFYSHGTGVRGVVYGVNLYAQVKVVVKTPDHQPIYFDNFELIGNENFFYQIRCQDSDQDVTEIIQQYLSGQYRFVGRNYNYRNRRWYGNFPKNGKERFVDGYMIVTFYALPQETKFLELKSMVHKAY